MTADETDLGQEADSPLEKCLFSRGDGQNGQKMRVIVFQIKLNQYLPLSNIQMQGPSIRKSKAAMISILSGKF